MKYWTTTKNHKIYWIVFGRSNVFLLTNNKCNILIDCSVKFSWKKLEKRLKKLGIANIDLLILTHSHFDHATNALKIRNKYGAKVLIHELEKEYLSTGSNIIPKGTNIFSKSIIKLIANRFAGYFQYSPCPQNITLTDHYNLDEYGFDSYVLHTPGHTLGSVSIIVDNEIAIVGDTMFGLFRKSVFPPFVNDVRALINSWRLLLDTNCRLFLPSHGTENSRNLFQQSFNKIIKKYPKH